VLWCFFLGLQRIMNDVCGRPVVLANLHAMVFEFQADLR
jgi:hypothetical protein